MLKNKAFSLNYYVFAFFLLVSYFCYGFYGEKQWVVPSIFLGVYLLMLWLYQLIRRQRNETVNVVSLSLLFIALLYGVTLFGEVESVEQTILKMMEWSFYACLIVLLSSQKENQTYSLLFFSYSVIISSLFLLYGVAFIPDGVLLFHNDLSGSGTRLGGFFQYPNALGALLGALLLYHFIKWSVEPEVNRTMGIIIYTCLLLLAFLLMMTESRGGWVAFAIGWFMVLWLLPTSVQIRWCIHSVVISSYALAMYGLLSITGIENMMWLMFVQIVGTMFVSWIVIKIPNWCYTGKRWALPMLVTSSFVVLSVSIVQKLFLFYLFPESLQTRLSTNLSSFSDRLLYMKDAWMAIHDHFWLGAGGEAWDFLVYRYQSAPYLSHEIHNFYLQLWLEVGIIGFSLIMILLCWSLFIVWKNNRMIFPVVFVILIHSAIDFTLSYGAMILLFLFLLIEGMGKKVYWTGGRSITGQLSKGLFVLSALFILIFSYRAIKAEQAESVENSIRLNPYKTDYYVQFNEMPSLTMEQREANLLEALQYEPHHSYLYYQLGVLEVELGEGEKALEAFKKSLLYDRFDQLKYERIMEYCLELSREYEKNDENERASFFRSERKLIFEQWEKLREETKTHSVHNQREFGEQELSL